MAAPKAPAGLNKAGETVWKSIVGKYELRADELFTLEDVCRVSDMLSLLRESWIERGMPLHTKGSMGQEVIHPLIGEIRAQQAQRNALWRQLKLPDADGGEVEVNQHRAAADTKWSKRGA